MRFQDGRRRAGAGTAASPGSGPDPRGDADPWEALRAEIVTCTKCPLHASRTHAVVYRGGRNPRVVFVGEAPSAEEDRVGLPFVGRSGRRLDAAVASLELDAEAYGVLNLIKCRPPRNRFDPAAARTCRPYLDRQLDLLRPRFLVTLGAHALAALDPEAPRILRCAGRPRRSAGRELFPLIHPAAALRSTALSRRWDHDLRALDRWLSGAERRGAR